MTSIFATSCGQNWEVLFMELVQLCSFPIRLGNLNKALCFEVCVSLLNKMPRSCAKMLYFEINNLSSFTTCSSSMTRSCTSTSKFLAAWWRAIVVTSFALSSHDARFRSLWRVRDTRMCPWQATISHLTLSFCCWKLEISWQFEISRLYTSHLNKDSDGDGEWAAVLYE